MPTFPMTIPGNDPIPLGSRARTIDSRQRSSIPSRRSLTRSPSPHFIFGSSFPPVDKANTARRKKSSSNGGINMEQPLKEADEPNEETHAPIPGRTPENLARRSVDLEIPRKVLHSSIGFLVVPLYISHTPPRHVIFYLSTALAVIIPADFIRLRYPTFAKTYEKFLGFLMRESEKTGSNGVIWYILGAIFVLAFYPVDIAVISILILSWCDTAASTFGRLYGYLTAPLPQSFTLPIPGSPTIPLPFARRKSVAGFLAASVTGSLISFGFWRWIVPIAETLDIPSSFVGSESRLSIVSAVIGLAVGVIEGLDLGGIDDNLSLPILSGAAVWGLLKLFT